MARYASHFKPRDGDLDSMFAALDINSDLTHADDEAAGVGFWVHAGRRTQCHG